MKTFNDLEFKTHPNCSGVQAKLFFQNGYGISVVRFKSSYGGFSSYTSNDKEWEIAVLKGTEEDWGLNYDTPITGDVIGHLKDYEVTNVMKQIQELPLDK